MSSTSRGRFGMIKNGWKAACLSRAVHREVKDDPGLVLHALGLVVMAGISLSVGMMSVLDLESQTQLELVGIMDRLMGTWLGVLTSVLGWALWGGIVYLLAGRFLGGKSSYNETLRVLGICYGPGLLRAFPGDIGIYLSLVGSVWVLVAAVVAIRAAHEIDWVGAIIPTTLGWLISFFFLPALILSSYNFALP
ncbi:YIP1 family protein [Dehalococcoidia bacterium]|nr:YIP1 family protein [Dehalococcoidia bacterium]